MRMLIPTYCSVFFGLHDVVLYSDLFNTCALLFLFVYPCLYRSAFEILSTYIRSIYVYVRTFYVTHNLKFLTVSSPL